MSRLRLRFVVWAANSLDHLLPRLAFERGRRVGYEMGHYDALAKAGNAVHALMTTPEKERS